MSKNPYLSVRIFTLILLSSTATAEIVNIQFSSTNSDLPRCLSLPSIINISRYVSGFLKYSLRSWRLLLCPT